jgi:hypothetical protein
MLVEDENDRVEETAKQLKIASNLSKTIAEEIRQQIDVKLLIDKIVNLAREADNVDMEELPRVKLKLEVYNSLLKKVMPDLKAMEVRTGIVNSSSLVLMVGNLSNNVISTNEDGKIELKNNGNVEKDG